MWRIEVRCVEGVRCMEGVRCVEGVRYVFVCVGGRGWSECTYVALMLDTTELVMLLSSYASVPHACLPASTCFKQLCVLSD